MSITGPHILDGIAALLTATPRTPRDIHKALGPQPEWVGTTTRRALSLLAKAGRAGFDGPDFQRRYRLPNEAERARFAEARRLHEIAAKAEENA